MKFGIFYEHQLPRPWEEDSEYQLLQNALEQCELADQLGLRVTATKGPVQVYVIEKIEPPSEN